VIESMNSARFMHETLEEHGWAAAPACARALSSPAPATRADRSPSTPPSILRWALFEAALNACKHPHYAERYQHTKRRLGSPARPQGRPHRPVAQTDRGDLAHAHPPPALRSGRRLLSSSRVTALFGNAPPDEPLRFSHIPATDEAMER
jgi:hypothetical protein